MKNVDFPIQIYGIASKSGAIQYGDRSKIMTHFWLHYPIVYMRYPVLLHVNDYDEHGQRYSSKL